MKQAREIVLRFICTACVKRTWNPNHDPKEVTESQGHIGDIDLSVIVEIRTVGTGDITRKEEESVDAVKVTDPSLQVAIDITSQERHRRGDHFRDDDFAIFELW